MKITLADKFIAWLTLLSGLSISAVAVYYSVAGLISIFAAAVIPIAIMGIVLELSKLVATVWLKQNWFIAPRFIKAYLLIAVTILMVITSMGIFGYLSKAHMDQTLVSGDVQSKIAIYDEKIKTAKDNIDANRKARKQMDEAVDQVMGRSSDEKGADKAVALRRAQAKERTRLLSEIAAEQKTIAQLSEERAPIAAEIRKVEAEVGPIKYIAALIYGDNPDNNLLERAVRWVIIVIVIVFDPLAVILLLASQYSFQWFRKKHDEEEEHPPYYVADVGEKPTEEELDDGVREPCPKCGTPMYDAPGIGVFCPNKECDVFDNPKGYEEKKQAMSFVDPGEHPSDRIEYEEEPVEEPKPHHPDTHPYLRQGFGKLPEGYERVGPLVAKSLTTEEIDQQLDKDLTEPTVNPDLPHPETAIAGQRYRIVKGGMSTYYEFDGKEWIEKETVNESTQETDPLDQWNKMIAEAERAAEAEIVRGEELLQDEESKKKSTYMIKENGEQKVKTKE